MARARTFGQLSRKSRDRAARIAFEEYGLSRRSAREMYNRGTYSPFAKDPENRVPQKIQREQAEDLYENARDRIREVFGDRPHYNDKHVKDNLRKATKRALRIIAESTDDELEDWAKVQDDNCEPPEDGTAQMINVKLTDPDLGFFTPNCWHNILWYH